MFQLSGFYSIVWPPYCNLVSSVSYASVKSHLEILPNIPDQIQETPQRQWQALVRRRLSESGLLSPHLNRKPLHEVGLGGGPSESDSPDYIRTPHI